jgi:hypothetical protein
VLVVKGVLVRRGERGSILPLAAIILLIFAFAGGAVLEVGQWFQHRRNLQVRTDAAALAGGDLFNECFNTANFTASQANADMEAAATKYSGIPGKITIPNYGSNPVGSSYNQAWEGGTPGNDGIGFQSSEFPTPGGALPARDAFGANSDECNTLEFDVKQTQDLPNLLSISPFTQVHGWARVELQTVQAVAPTMPLAIPNFDLTDVGVTFVDETAGGTELSGCTGSIVVGGCTYSLTKNPPPPNPPDPTNYVAQDGEHLARFTLSNATINLPTPTGASKGDLIGVRVSVGGGVGSCAGTPGTSGANSYACLELNGPPYNGLVGIRDFAPSQSALPALYDVLPSETCSSDTSPFVGDATGATTCPATIQAKIDFGTGSATNPETSPAGPGARVTADVGGISVPMDALQWVSNNVWLWQGSLSIPIGALSTQSEYPVTLSWTSTKPVGGSKKGNFGGDVVQRFTSADLSDDGPVRMMGLTGSGPSGSPYSGTPGSDTVSVTVVVSEAGISNELSILRASHNGSSTSFILCASSNGHTSPYNPEGGAQGIIDGIQNGCSFQYTINPTLTCPDPGGAMPLPADCVQNKPTSDQANTVKTALNNRLCGGNGGKVYLNNWPNDTVSGDLRRVTLLLTSYNAYVNGGKTNGAQPYPVAGFGDFYITGFWGDACPQALTDTPPHPGFDDPQPQGASKGDIWGYFIKYSNGAGVPSGRKCVANEFGECVPALVR